VPDPSPLRPPERYLDRPHAEPDRAALVPEPERLDLRPDALRVLASVLPEVPVVIVLDELPWLAEQDEIFDGALQTAWDRLLSRRPVLLLLLGSDLHMMERLTAYDRPFFGRADNLLLGPLNPAEIGRALGLDAMGAIDASLLSGGLPRILRAWPAGVPALDFAELDARIQRLRCSGFPRRRCSPNPSSRHSTPGDRGSEGRQPNACQHRR
jgi:uncharacterized protein